MSKYAFNGIALTDGRYGIVFNMTECRYGTSVFQSSFEERQKIEEWVFPELSVV